MRLRLIVLVLPFLVGPALRADADPALDAQLRAEDERLLVAVHRGGRAEWQRVTTADFLYVEEGGILTRDQLLARMDPDGRSPLRIVDYHVSRTADLALVVHHDVVPTGPDRDRPPGTYVMTETWQRIGGTWKLHIVHVDAVHNEPPTLRMSDQDFEPFVGTYRSHYGTTTIRRDGDCLIADDTDGSEAALKPETVDVFFTPDDLRRRTIFQRDAAGRVVGYIRRDENNDVIWTRERSR